MPGGCLCGALFHACPASGECSSEARERMGGARAGDGVGGYINTGNPETRKTEVGAVGGRTTAKQS